MVVLSIAAALLIGQQSQIGPVCPPGSSQAFQRSVQAVCELLSEGKFDEAGKIAQKMPRPRVTIGWDEKGIPVNLRPVFRRALDRSIAGWEQVEPEYEYVVAAKGEIQISFVKSLPVNERSALPGGAVFISSDSPQDPRVEAIIALNRMNPAVSVEAPTVENECYYAIGTYFGLAEQPKIGGAMGRTDGLTQYRASVSTWDIRLARRNIEISDELREAAAKKIKLEPAKAELFAQPSDVNIGNLVQGELFNTSIQVDNRGNVPMTISVIPDCGCFSVRYKEVLGPGESTLVNIQINSTEFPGPFNKGVHIFSGDPDMPERRIGFKGHVTPAFRVLNEEKSAVLQMTDEGIKTNFFVIFPESSPFKINSISLLGVNGITDIEPWSGKLADPAMGEGLRDRVGYKVTALVSPSQVRGRVLATLQIKTDSKMFPNIQHSFYVQRGIAAMPVSLFFGDIGKEPQRAFIVLSRLDKPFKVTGVKSSSPLFKAFAEPLPTPGEYKLVVEYLGKGPIGMLSATIEVTTNDPQQPKIEIPVSGHVT